VLGKILSNTFWNFYDHLGLMILVNIMAFIVMLPAFALPVVLWVMKEEPPQAWLSVALICLSTTPLALAGLGFVSRRLVEEGEATWRDFFFGIRRLAYKAYLLFCLEAIVAAVVLANIAFYARMGQSSPWLALPLLGFAIWIFVLLVFSSQYSVGLIAAGEGPLRAMKKAFRLVGTHPLVAAGLFLESACLAFLALVSIVGLPLFFLSAVFLLQAEAVRVLQFKSEGKEEKVPDIGAGRTLREIFFSSQKI